MLKSFKIFLIFFLFILLPSIVFSTDITINKDIFINEKDSTEITKMVLGNAFVLTDDFILSPYEEGGVISGDLFICSKSIHLQSDILYDENGDFEGVDVASKIFGNVYGITNKFTLDPGCSIENDLYLVADEINISEDSFIYGNLFIVSNNVNIDGQVAGNVYCKSKNFSLGPNGYLLQDLFLTSDNVTLSGLVRRNSKISFNSLDISGNAEIQGNLEYSSYKQLDLSDKNISGKILYNKLSSFNILDIVFTLIVFILYCLIIYFIIKKLFNLYLENISKYTVKNILLRFGIGLLILIIIPILIILLILVKYTLIFAIPLLVLYILILTISVPIFIASISEFANSKIEKLPAWLDVIIASAIAFALALIPYAGPIVLLLISIIGIGIIVTNVKRTLD